MSKLTLTKRRLGNAVWELLLTGAKGDAPPKVQVTHQGAPLQDVTLSKGTEPGEWDMKVPLPSDAIADGIQVFLVHDEDNDRRLGELVLIGGDVPPDDLRAEVTLLRAELDMLKRAFRRHCNKTA